MSADEKNTTLAISMKYFICCISIYTIKQRVLISNLIGSNVSDEMTVIYSHCVSNIHMIHVKTTRVASPLKMLPIIKNNNLTSSSYFVNLVNFIDFSLTVKAAAHECVIRTGLS